MDQNIIDPDAPFRNCRLEREKYAVALTSIVESNHEGFVLAINNSWGAGKTTFVKMWQQSLQNKGYKTVYFNAWENDHETDALIALMGELNSIVESKTESLFNEALSKAAILCKSIVPSALKALGSKVLGDVQFKELLEVVSESAGDLMEHELKEYLNRKKSLTEFKDKLTAFVASSCNDKPLIFFIDELDRCRPNFAVEVLEKVKHLFSIKRIIFVLSIDKIQLGHAVRGVYGSELIDSNEYLRRFIDIEYSIPEPNPNLFLNYLNEKHEIYHFFQLGNRAQNHNFRYEFDEFNKAFIAFTNHLQLTLRQQEKIFLQVQLLTRSTDYNSYFLPSLTLSCLLLKMFYPEVYSILRTKKLNYNQFLESLASSLFKQTQPNNVAVFKSIEAQLVFHYSNFYNEETFKKTIIYDENSQRCIVSSHINAQGNEDNFLDAIKFLDQNRSLRNFALNYLLDKIDLTNPLIKEN